MSAAAARIYIACWAAACALALVLFVLERRTIPWRDYGRFLAQPWKLISFAIAAVGLTVLAPWTGDPTWDYWDAAFMAIFTFVSAPWAVGTLYRRTSWRLIYCAICVWLFSASWSYDGYLWLRQHIYPETWSSNLAASSVLYAAAGLLWNLEFREGTRFSFQRADWPRPIGGAQFRRVAWLAVAIMILVAIGFLPFFLH